MKCEFCELKQEDLQDINGGIGVVGSFVIGCVASAVVCGVIIWICG